MADNIQNEVIEKELTDSELEAGRNQALTEGGSPEVINAASQEQQVEKPTPTETETKRTKRTDWEKNYNELRSMNDRRFNESQSEMKKLKEELQFFQPFKDQIKQALDEKKLSEQQKLATDNPVEAARRAALEAANETIKPFQTQMQQLMAEKTVDNTVNYLKQTYGEELFETNKETMAEILTEAEKTHGPEVSNFLAQNPDYLLQLSLGRLGMNYYTEQKAAISQGKVNQNKAVAFAKGDAKPNSPAPKTGAKSFNEMSDDELMAARDSYLRSLQK